MANVMSKNQVMVMVGEFIKQGLEYDVCLQAPIPYDEEASACAQTFFTLCENGTRIHEAFVKAFF